MRTKICATCGEPAGSTGSMAGTVHQFGPTDHDFTPETPAQTMARDFGREPTPGFRLVRNIMTGKVVEESEDTPYTCSVASETYWSS